jgi:hypothetical protein
MSTTVLNVWRLGSIMLTATAMSAVGAHVLELRAKLRYEPSLYVRLHRTLYPDFGRIAGPAESFALMSVGTLAWWTRRRRPAAFPWTVAAAGSLGAAHGIYWGVVQPVNTEMLRWPLDAIPGDWAAWRDRWEYGHAARGILVTFALAALAWSTLTDGRPTSGQS